MFQNWAKKYMRIDFSLVISPMNLKWHLMDLMDEPKEVPVTKKRQWIGGIVMICAGIINQTIVGPFEVDEEVKLSSTNNCDFMDKTFFASYKSQSIKVKCVFMHDNAPSHASKLTHEFFEHKRFIEGKIMDGDHQVDLNPIKNLSLIVKMNLYEGGKEDLSKTIKTTMLEIEPAGVTDNRSLVFIEKKGHYAGHCWRSRDELISDILLWTPSHGHAKAGGPPRTYIQQLCADTGCSPEDQPEAMDDREGWRERIRDIRADSATWWWKDSKTYMYLLFVP